MKLVKLSVLALSMGLFVASCGNGSGDAAKTDSTTTTTTTTAPAAPAAPAPAADTTTAPPAKPADAAAAPATAAPAGDTKMESKMTDTKTKTVEKTKSK